MLTNLNAHWHFFTIMFPLNGGYWYICIAKMIYVMMWISLSITSLFVDEVRMGAPGHELSALAARKDYIRISMLCNLRQMVHIVQKCVWIHDTIVYFDSNFVKICICSSCPVLFGIAPGIGWALHSVQPIYGTNTWPVWCCCWKTTHPTCDYFSKIIHTGGNRTMVAAATIVNMAAAKKAQQNVFALYHSYNRTIHLDFTLLFQDCPRASQAFFDSHTM